jgi:hypothetical protein
MASHSYPRGAGAGRNDSEDRAVLAAAHLTERDRCLVRLVGEHRVLTTGQLCAIGFENIVTARHRLGVLARIGVLRRFRPHPETGSAPWHYLLGPVGAALLGAEDRDEKKWVPQVRADRQLALERSQRLSHMTGWNWFFVALAAHARAGGGELREWLNEIQAASRYQDRVFVAPGDWDRLPNPDGLGTWAEAGREVTFLLEYDTGTENPSRLAGKLAATPSWPPRWPVPAPRARRCCSACPARAASSPPAAPWPGTRTPASCGSPRPRSTRARPARPGRCGCRWARRPGRCG